MTICKLEGRNCPPGHGHAAPPPTEAENAALRARVADLERTIDAYREDNGRLHNAQGGNRTRIRLLEAERDTLRATVSRYAGHLEAISAQLIKPRGLLVDCKVCGSCWAGDNDPPESHDQNRYDVFDKLDGEECALGLARAFHRSRIETEPASGKGG